MTYVIEIEFKSIDPDRAAQIANAVADAFIVDQLEARYQTIRRATAWLQDRLNELRGQASAAERAVVEYKAKNNIVDTGGRLLTNSSLPNSTLPLSGLARRRRRRRCGSIASRRYFATTIPTPQLQPLQRSWKRCKTPSLLSYVSNILTSHNGRPFFQIATERIIWPWLTSETVCGRFLAAFSMSSSGSLRPTKVTSI